MERTRSRNASIPSWGEDILTVSGTTRASFSQFYLNLGNDAIIHMTIETQLGLAQEFDDGQIILTAARHGGPILVEAQIHGAAPALQPEWTDVVGFSVTTGTVTTIDPWDGVGADSLPLATQPGITYRVRYTIIDGQLGWEQFDRLPRETSIERYLLQLWPEPERPPEVIKCQSPWAQYWEYNNEATRLVPTLSGLPPAERVAAVIDLALSLHPDTAKKIRDGDDDYLRGVSAYLGVLKLQTHHDPDFGFLRDVPGGLRTLVKQHLGL